MITIIFDLSSTIKDILYVSINYYILYHFANTFQMLYTCFEKSHNKTATVSKGLYFGHKIANICDIIANQKVDIFAL